MSERRRSVPCVSALAALAALGLTRGAAAQVPPGPPVAAAEPSPPEASAPLEVRVIGARPEALQRIPGSGEVLDAKDIRRAQPENVAEMLRRVPGLLVRQDESGGTRLDVGVRGLDPTRARRVLMLEDGIPIEINPYAEPDLYFSPPIERYREIEVVKGSGSILFGPQTIGGVINFLTIAPPSDGRKVSLEADGGQFGYVKALAAYGDSFQNVRYIVQAFHKQANGARDEPWQSDDVFAKIAFDTSPHGQAMVKIGFHDERAVSTEVGETQAMYLADPQRKTFAPNDFLHVRKYEASLIQEHQFFPELKLRTLAYAYTTNRVWRRQDFDRFPVPGTLYDRIAGDVSTPEGAIYFKHSDTIVDRTYDVAGVEPKLEIKATTGALEHDIETGARVLVESGHRAQRAAQRPDSDAGDLQIDESHQTYAFAGYVLDRIAFKDWLVVSPGLRIEHAQFERQVNRDMILGVPTDEAVRGSTFDTGVIPGVGIVLGPSALHAFAGVHVGYAPPRVVTSISNTGVDTQLDPEKSIEWEVGLRTRVGGFLRFETTAFLTNFTNQIIVGNALTGAQTNLVNGGATRHIGAEGGVVVGVGKALSLPLAIDVGVNGTFARATFVGGQYAGNTLPYAPEVVGNGYVDVEHPGTGLGLQVAVSYVGKQFADPVETVAVDPTGQDGQLDAYAIVDVSARYKNKATGLTASVAVKNVGDATYVLSRQPQGIFPGAPRTVTGGLRWDWAK